MVGTGKKRCRRGIIPAKSVTEGKPYEAQGPVDLATQHSLDEAPLVFMGRGQREGV